MGQAINPAEMFDFVAQDVTGDYYIFRSNKSKGQTEVAKNTASARPKPTAKPRSKVHRVKSGENLSVIASKYGTTVAKLCKLNGISLRLCFVRGKSSNIHKHKFVVTIKGDVSVRSGASLFGYLSGRKDVCGKRVSNLLR